MKCRVHWLPVRVHCWWLDAPKTRALATVLNKMDLPQADPDKVKKEIEEIIGIDATDACQVSAKSGMGIEDALEDLVKRIPPPEGDREAPLQALIIDSWFDSYLGVISLVRDRG